MDKIEKLKVDLGSRSYEILIGGGLLANAGKHLAQVLPEKKVFIVTDDNVAKLYLKTLEEALDKEGIISHSHIIAHGEQSKSFANLENLLDRIFATKPDRKTTLIALGGGVVGDLTGFAASIVLRGINFIQIPTTLLAQVDSSVGGKTGINNKFGKNLVGSFYQPLLVLADTDTLQTLPQREFLAGYAEVAKYAFINDAEFFNRLHRANRLLPERIGNFQSFIKVDAATKEFIRDIVKTACMSKSRIVSADEREGGVRALLNLGHTFGHALEKATGYSDKLLHGEAVAIGMVFAFKLSHKMGLCEEAEVHKLAAHLSKMGLPISALEIKKVWDMDDLMASMRQDKKAFNGKLTFILARKIGDCFIENNVPENLVREVIVENLAGE
jgi:3-dehydroquinate synthase